MFNAIPNVHVAVNSLEEATKDFKERFGLVADPPIDQPATGVRLAVVHLGGQVIEFVEPLDPEQGPVSKFLKNKGEGIYMMGWAVEDVDAAVKQLEANGVRLLNADAESRAAGANVFIHPKSSHGVIVQLVEMH